MQIISFLFFGFVALVFAILYACNKLGASVKTSNRILLAASYIFVIYADWRFAAVLALLSLAAYACAKKEKYTIGIAAALVSLAFFKYTNFFAESFANILGMNYTSLNIILPLGISFYTFSAIGYIVDVKRGTVKAHNLEQVALYLAFFPKITSGPIQKSADFFAQSNSVRKVGWSTFLPGIQIFMFGLFKKIVLADNLSVFVNQVYDTPLAFGSMTVFFAAVAYSFQIYFDFSGYSDMAIGIAKIIGINLPRNFNLPYLSHNVTELWKRWHITLSEWLWEYLYISLGGNRKGRLRTYFNLIATMVIGGIWHGAAWTYVFWGFLHGAALAVHKWWCDVTKSPSRTHCMLSNILSIILTFIFTTFCWIFFRAESLSKAFVIIKRIFSFKSGLEQPYMWLFVSLIILTVSSITVRLRSNVNIELSKKKNVCTADAYYPILDLSKFWNLVAFFVFCGLILCLAYTGGSPFINGKY